MGEHRTSARRFVGLHTIRYVLLAADLFSLALSVTLAGALAFVFSEAIRHIEYTGFVSRELGLNIAVWVTLSVAMCIWFDVNGQYSVRAPLRSDLAKVWSALLIALLIDGFIQYTLRQRMSRAWLLSIWPIAAIVLPVGRLVIRRFLDRAGVWKLRAAVFGRGAHSAAVKHALVHDFYVGYEFIADLEIAPFLGLSGDALARELRTVLQRSGADIVILIPDAAELQRANNFIDALNIQFMPFCIVPPLYRLPLIGLRTEALLNSDAILLTVRRGLTSPVSRVVKRLFDLAVALVLLVFLLPLFILIGLLVLRDGRPVFFRHERIGRGRVPFLCLKFRTMDPMPPAVFERLVEQHPTAGKEWAANYKLREDPRVRPLGRFLRATSLDELPQLINVLRGEMSLVGPRPVVENELNRYYRDDALYYYLVRPGMTGLWQISGRNRTSYERRVELDTWYVRNWNLWMDIVILASTLPSMISTRGSY